MNSQALDNPLAATPTWALTPKSCANGGKMESIEPARRLVGEFVGHAFYGVLMKQMQESKLKTGLFDGGRGEEAFQAQLGMELSARMGRATGDPIADRIYRSFEKHLKAKGWTPEKQPSAVFAEQRT